ncbi:MAG TPA: hypothetical protein VGE38_09905 [Nocardioides sp.]|uniref:hypothetical protein n=1 Tax=Nocardioides sp. TaxID=35761 RepID=UPI002EDB3FBB
MMHTKAPMASFGWRDIHEAREVLHACQVLDIDRDEPALEAWSKRLAKHVRTRSSVGGLLMWNQTRDTEGGAFFMVSGQTPAEERQVLENAFWLISCGAVYAASRVGSRHWKEWPDYRTTIAGDRYLVWVLSNAHDVEGMLR